MPLTFAVFGFLSFCVKKMIKPASGMIKDRMAKPTLAFLLPVVVADNNSDWAAAVAGNFDVDLYSQYSID